LSNFSPSSSTSRFATENWYPLLGEKAGPRELFFEKEALRALPSLRVIFKVLNFTFVASSAGAEPT